MDVKNDNKVVQFPGRAPSLPNRDLNNLNISSLQRIYPEVPVVSGNPANRMALAELGRQAAEAYNNSGVNNPGVKPEFNFAEVAGPNGNLIHLYSKGGPFYREFNPQKPGGENA